MIKVKEVLVVEGKYDKIKLSSLVDGIIIETNGFGIFKDKKRMEMIRRLAAKNGLVILTDSDGAGFLIRSKLCSCIPPEQIKNAYIPDVLGKEKRKKAPSKEGKLGVEGMEAEILKKVLERAGINVDESTEEKITKADFFDLGLSGGKNSAQMRSVLTKELELPERISANGLLNAVRGMYGREEFFQLCGRIFQTEK